MIWLIFALLSALFFALADFFAKRSLKKIDEYMTAWSKWLFALPIIFVFIIFTGSSLVIEGGMTIYIALILLFCFEIIAIVFYMKALKAGNLVSTIPFLSFTPVFLLITSFIFIGEVPGLFGIIGVLMIVIGAYILNIREIRKGLLEPFRAIAKEKAALFMLATAFLYALINTTNKFILGSMSPMFLAFVDVFFIVVLFIPIILIKSGGIGKQLKNSWKKLIPIGICTGLMSVFGFIALNMTVSSYFIGVKRMSILFAMMFGVIFFKERNNLIQNFIGAIIMILGVLAIVLL
ncbi:MAG: EamA family transporter [Candidatus Aenigmatarchaeota archaeon]